ncbi:MAG: protein phosphatase 2C domain-containing protein [Akkermansiaceae bacterium]|jgi:serine/threonine protein phosphatase PrpC
MKELKDGIRSSVHLDFRGHVHKTFRGTDADKRFANEVTVLKALEDRGAPNVPRLLGHDPLTLTIITTSCGAPAPLVTREKARALFQELEDLYGVRHDDPEPRNVTYSPQLGRFCLIDFELSQLLPAPSGIRVPRTNILRVGWSADSTKGKDHTANDDSWLALTVNPLSTDPLPKSGEIFLDPSHLVLAVSDGMGGSNAGEFASSLLMSRIRKDAAGLYDHFRKGEHAEEALSQLVIQCHNDLNTLAAQNGNATDMGATLTLAWVSHERLYWAHVGDSRLYYVANLRAHQITRDDCQVWDLWQRGILTEYAYRQHPRRCVLFDALGGGHHKPLPKTGSMKLQSSQRLMLCSDGIMDGLWEDQIREVISSDESIDRITGELIDKSNKVDPTDDTTVIMAEIARI